MSDAPTTTPANTDPKPGDGAPGGDGTPTGGQQQSGTYTPPATQADLDRIIGDRVARERSKFADYDDVKAKAGKYDEAVEADKSELEKEREARQKIEAENATYKQREQEATWCAEVSKETGVPSGALRGSTREAILAHAETLKPLIAQQQPNPADPSVPTIGTTPATPGNVPLKDQIAAAEAANRPDLVAVLKAAQLGTTT